MDAVRTWLRSLPRGYDLAAARAHRRSCGHPVADPMLWAMGGGHPSLHQTREQLAAMDPSRLPSLAREWGYQGTRFDTLNLVPPPSGPPPIAQSLDLPDEIALPVEVLAALKGQVTRIHLGPDGLFGGNVEAALPVDYEPSTSKDEMLSEVLPAFWDNLPLSWEEAHANVSDRWNQPLVYGLFWDDGWGFMHRAMLYAMQLLYEHADLARDDTAAGYSKFDTGELRDRISAGTLPLYVTDEQLVGTTPGVQLVIISPEGHVSMNFSSVDYLAVTLEVIEIPVVMRIFAGVADYYFWWAHRLHSSAHETGNLGHWWVGLLCARAALSELVQMAAIVAHEWTHMTSGSGFHCTDLVDKEFGCVEYMIEATFMYGTWMKLALPRSRNPTLTPERVPEPEFDDRYAIGVGGTDSQEIDGRNQVDGNEVVIFILVLAIYGPIVLLNVIDDWIDTDGSCKKFSIEMERMDFWKAGGGYSATWRIPSRCGGAGYETGAFVEKPS